MDLHTIYGIGLGSTLLGGIKQQSLNTGTTVVGEPSSGSVWPKMVYLTAQNPVIPFTTDNVKAALDVMGLLGVNIADLAGGTKLQVYAQAIQHGGSRKAGSTHRRIVANHGMIVPRTLSCDHQGDATLTFDSIISYDGTNEPYVVTESVALPGSLTDAERFSLGKATIESLLIGQLTNLSIDFGLEASAEGADSDIWATAVWVKTSAPVITLQGTELDWLGAARIPLTGKAATHTNTKIYLRKRESASADGFVLDATAEHISVTAAGLAHIDTAWEGSGDAPNSISMTLTARDDGSNDPLVFDTATAIT